MSLSTTVLDHLRRFPDAEAPNLFAVDAADRLILDTAHDAVVGAAAGAVVVIGDHYGALALGALAERPGDTVRVHQDSYTGELALNNNAARAGLPGTVVSGALDRSLLAGATVVLLQLPRSLAELTEICETIAAHADPAVTVYAGGRDKHMTPKMNSVLADAFESVAAGRGRQKSRVLTASGPRPVSEFTYPVREHISAIDLTVVAHGAAFAGASLDIGTRYLLGFLAEVSSTATNAVDLGCGTGILATYLARMRPDVHVTAVDRSAAAVASAIGTAAANSVEVEVRRDDGMSGFEDASVDVIVCNPPFHEGAAVHTGGASKMFADAGRVLRPRGEMWTVYNTHLNHRAELVRTVGETTVVGRNAKFTVARSVGRVRP